MVLRRDVLQLLGAGGLAWAVAPVRARETPPALNESVLDSQLRTLANAQLREMSHQPMVLDALKAQNAQTRAYSQDRIERLEGDWRREVYNMNRRTLIPAVMETPASHFLKRAAELSDGLYTEFILLDGRGLVAALSTLAALYWHGDRDRWQVPYEAGVHGVWVGSYERNTASDIWQRQVSITVSDPASLYPLGVLCAGIAVEQL